MQHLFTLATATALLLLVGCGDTGTNATGGPVAMRRLTSEQYRNAIEDAFGGGVEVAGRFEPESRRDGLNALGASLVAVTSSGFEQYETMARNIAGQVTSPEQRANLLPCQPASATAPDNACTEQIIRTFGRVLLRRPLEDLDVAPRVEAAAQTANAQGDFYAGVQLALTSLMVAPQFLFRVDAAEPAPLPDAPDRLQLTDLSLATKLSYFLWNRGPDEELLSAAERGELSDPQTLAKQVDRMLASAYLADGVRAYFEDVFSFDKFDDLNKDVMQYPLFNNQVAAAAREQTLRFMVDNLVAQHGDYRSVFTSRELPMTRLLGPIYGMPVRNPEGWEIATAPTNQPRAGLLSHASFAILSHTARCVHARGAALSDNPGSAGRCRLYAVRAGCRYRSQNCTRPLAGALHAGKLRQVPCADRPHRTWPGEL
jgi:Protein of unknown function (DUF1592)/Protein of unknown function (DUF1595)/Protein of unknown function (DUF1587)